MSDKAEESQRQAERMQAEVQRFVAGGEESTSVRLPDGSAMTVAKLAGPNAGMRFEGPGGGLSGRSYPAAAERPADYPAELPFVADVPVLVQQLGPDGMTLLFWMDAPDPLAVRASIEKQLAHAGWVRGESQEVPLADATVTSYRKGEVERTLMGGGKLMMLMEKRPPTV